MADPIELLIQGRARGLGPGFAVRRVLPSARRRMVGPFIFLDHFGPIVVPPAATAWRCGRIRISGSPPSPTCSVRSIFHRGTLGYAHPDPPG